MKTPAIALAAGLLLASGSAFAADKDFSKVDTDRDGKLTMAELAAAHPQVDADTFAAIDTDASGDVSAEEYEVATKSSVDGSASTTAQ